MYQTAANLLRHAARALADRETLIRTGGACQTAVRIARARAEIAALAPPMHGPSHDVLVALGEIETAVRSPITAHNGGSLLYAHDLRQIADQLEQDFHQ